MNPTTMKIEYYIVDGNGCDIGEGPWDKRRTYDRTGAQEFLDCEVGAKGAKVVAIRKREEYDIDGLLAQNREMSQEMQRKEQIWQTLVADGIAKSPSRRSAAEKMAIAYEMEGSK